MKLVKGLLLASMLPAAGVFLASCGGEDSTESSSSASSALGAQVASSALSMTDMALTAASGDLAQDVTLNRKVNLARTVAKLNQGRTTRSARSMASVIPQAACDGGGTVVTDATSTTYSDCIYMYGSTKVYYDGSISYTETSDGFTATSGSNSAPYILRIYQSNGTTDQLLGEVVMQVSFSGTYGANTTCGLDTVPTSTTIAMNGSISFRSYSGDGTALENVSSSLSNLTIAVSSSDYDSVTCEPAIVDMTMSGSSSVVDSIDSSNSISMSVAAGTPLTIHWEDMGSIAEVEVSGTVTIDTSCFDGTLTLATLTPIQVSTFDEDACPVAGVVKVTGSMTGTITYNSNGSVSIDEGSNGTVDQTLASCDEAETCS